MDTEMRITAEILQAAQQVIGLDFTLPEREQMLKRVNQSLEFFGNLREGLPGQFGASRHPVRSHSPRERALPARRETGQTLVSDP